MFNAYKRYWEQEPNVVAEVIRDHKKGVESQRSHPWWHAGMVADFAGRLLWKKTQNDKEALMAEACGWFHSVDYYGDWDECLARYKKHSALFSSVEWEEIVITAKNHSKKSDENVSLLMRCVQAADKFATMGFLGAMKVAIHRPDLPIADPEYLRSLNPQTTYKNPKSTFEHMVFHRYEWMDWALKSGDRDVIDLFQAAFDWLQSSQRLSLLQLEGVEGMILGSSDASELIRKAVKY